MFRAYEPHARRLLVAALVLLTAAYGLFLFYRGFFDPDEGRYSEIPREMVARGDWMEMRMMSFRYYEKPILSYWLTAPAIAVCGPRDWAARMPLLLPLLGTLLLMAGLVRRHWPREARDPALLITFSLAGIFSGIALLMTDAFLVFWFALVCVALFEAYAAGASPARRRNGLLLAAVAGALGFMTKGAVAIVLPGAALFCWLLWERRYSELGKLTGSFALLAVPLVAVIKLTHTDPQRDYLTHISDLLCSFLTSGEVAIVLPSVTLFLLLLVFLFERRFAVLRNAWLFLAVFLFLAIVAPWLWWLEQHNPGFCKYFVIDEHLSRFTGTRATQGHPEVWWFFIALTPVMLMPWSLFGVRAIARAWGRHDSLTRFLVCWSAIVIVFFSISSGKLMSYILPAFPALGLLIGRWGLGEPLDDTPRDRRFWRIGLIGPFAVLFALVGLWSVSWFQLYPARVPQIAGASAVLFIPLALAVWLARRSLRSFAGVGLLVSSALLGLALIVSPLSGLNFSVFLHLNNSRLYQQMAVRLQPEDQLIMFFDYRPALLFYTQRDAIAFQMHNELAYGMAAEPQRRGCLETFDQLRAVAKECRGKLYGFVDPSDIAKRLGPIRDTLVPTDFPKSPDTVVFEVKFPKDPPAP